MSDKLKADPLPWMQEHKHLPECLRDFHDQKDLFRAMHETIDMSSGETGRDVDWITGQCYVIDIFLWFMARRGYTMQRSRAKLNFFDLQETIDQCKQRRLASSLPVSQS